ncbi:MAG: bifunctional 4-hydroxy-2-oxoglutarate aldolase/2-dehydro-3-deoxy-phosphogluconate aldolase [Deferribacterota bacterium]|nr:bifunctional 4-hydroxy-2-oxoglutarate aldolase/2-dehydro-3-deoxy-phosphogluconate aldolase [Deferribacterota bacterium]
MKIYETLETIRKSKIILVIRAENEDECNKIIKPAIKAGIKAIEITMTVPGAVNIIEKMNHEYKNKNIIIGAGTVNDANMATACISAGSKFIVSPIFDKATKTACDINNILYIPGAFTPNEIFSCIKAGIQLIKIFPASWIGAGKIKELKGPFPQLEFLPTGGVNIDNVKDWFDVGAFAVAVGSAITKYAKDGSFEKIEEISRNFLKMIQ